MIATNFKCQVETYYVLEQVNEKNGKGAIDLNRLSKC